MSDADRLAMRYREETTFATAETGETFQNMRLRSESLGQDNETTESEELRSDRQTTDMIDTDVSTSGDIAIEMSFAAHDDLIVAGLQATGWSSPVVITASTISTTNATATIADSANGFGSLVAGQWVKVSGFTGPAKSQCNGFYKILTAAAGAITVAPAPPQDAAAGDSVRVEMGAQITNGTTLKTFNFEKEFTDLSNEFALFLGAAIGGFSLDASRGAVITGTFTIIGSTETSQTATTGDGSPTAAPTNDVMAAVDEINAIFENGEKLGSTQFSFSVENNLRTRSELGTLGASEAPGSGKFRVTGTLQAYFKTKALMDKYLNRTVTNLAIALEDGAGNGYVFEFPEVRFTNGRRVAGGQNTDIMADMDWSAYMDASEGITMRVVRFVPA
jgi:hypothetical protein